MEVKNLTLQQSEIKNVTQRTVSIIGQKGTGKTTLVKIAMSELPPSTPCLVFDPLNVIDSKRKYVINKKSLSFGGIAAKLVNRHLKKNETVVIAFDRLLGSEIVEFVDAFVPGIRMSAGVWIFDEIHEFVPQSAPGYSLEVERMIRHTRNDNNGVVLTTQRPAFVAKNVLALTDFMILFRLSYPNDLEVVKKLLSTSESQDEIIKNIQGKGFLEGYTIDYDPKAGDFG